MKIVTIVSSCRKDGNTSRICGLFEKELKTAASKKGLELEIERILPGILDIRMCRGCRVCFDKGEEFCPLKDDLLQVREQILQADGLIVGSPVYVEDVNGVMKNLLDRLAFNSHRPGFTGKAAFIFTTSGVGSSNHSIRTMKTSLSTWGMAVTGSRRFRTGALTSVEELEVGNGKAIRKSAEKLIHSIHGNLPQKPSFSSLIYFTVQQTYWIKRESNRDSADYRYWLNHGWLEKSCSFYFPHRPNPVMGKLAYLIGRLVAVFFI